MAAVQSSSDPTPAQAARFLMLTRALDHTDDIGQAIADADRMRAYVEDGMDPERTKQDGPASDEWDKLVERGIDMLHNFDLEKNSATETITDFLQVCFKVCSKQKPQSAVDCLSED
jgi:hypothetical protein